MNWLLFSKPPELGAIGPLTSDPKVLGGFVLKHYEIPKAQNTDIDRMSNQIPLPGFPVVQTPAEQVFVNLARRWLKEAAAVERDRPLPRLIDEIALASLLLAVEHGGSFSRAARSEAHKNAVACERRLLPWIDQLPWQLSVSLCDGLNDRAPLEQLVSALDHPKSAVRVWLMEVAWMVRRELELCSALEPLLENVASTLAGVEMAWGLGAELFGRVDEFIREAAEFEPRRYSGQYADRVRELKGQSLVQTQARFWWLENRCRRVITETAFSLCLPKSGSEIK